MMGSDQSTGSSSRLADQNSQGDTEYCPTGSNSAAGGTQGTESSTAVSPTAADAQVKIYVLDRAFPVGGGEEQLHR